MSLPQTSKCYDCRWEHCAQLRGFLFVHCSRSHGEGRAKLGFGEDIMGHVLLMGAPHGAHGWEDTVEVRALESGDHEP